jgi:hypothetical protein
MKTTYNQIISRDGKMTGTPTGASCRCNMEGCRGTRISIKWPNGKNTRPCTKGLELVSHGVWKII